MDLFDGILLVHVLSAIFLVGTIPLDYLLVRRVLGSGDHAQLAKTIHDLEWVENRVAIPTSALLLLSGIAMTWGPYARWPLFGAPWFPTVGLGLLVVLLVVFAGILPAKYQALHGWATAGGEGPMPAADWQGWSAAGLLLAIAAVTIMVVKPF